jgi:hypothetical protein
MAYWLAWEEPRAVVDLAHVEKFFARNLGGLIRARTCAGPAREGNSRTPSMYADEKSDEAVVPRKRPNKGRQLPAEDVEGRASPEGNSRQAAVVRTLSRDATSIRLAAVRRSACGFQPRAADVRPEGGARCVSSARRDLCGGRSAMSVPTATICRPFCAEGFQALRLQDDRERIAGEAPGVNTSSVTKRRRITPSF